MTLANALLKNGQDTQALHCFNKALLSRPHDFDSLLKKSVLTMQFGAPDEKMRAMNDVIRQYPRFMHGYDWLGEFLEKNGRMEEAFAIYQKMAAIFPDEPIPYINLARASEALGRREDMKKYLKKAARLNPTLAKDPAIQKILHSGR